MVQLVLDQLLPPEELLLAVGKGAGVRLLAGVFVFVRLEGVRRLVAPLALRALVDSVLVLVHPSNVGLQV